MTVLLALILALLSTGCEPDSGSAGKGKTTSVQEAASSKEAKGENGLPAIDIEQFRLANGLNVILHVDEKLPAVNVNLWYHVGSKNEQPGRTGFAHLFEHVMFQGSQHVQGEYLTLIERAGANLRTGGVNGTTSFDRTNYFETVPTTSLEYALWLESDRMGFLLPSLDQKSFDNQRNVVKNEKRQGDNRPYSAQRYIVAEKMFPANHPYSHSPIGSMEDLSAATLENVKEFFRTYYAPNNASLTLSGNFDKEQAKALVQKYFGPLPAGPAIERPRVMIPKLERTVFIEHEERAPQPKLTLVWHVPEYFDPEEAPLDYAAQILGQGKNSRLYKKLVREEDLASQVSVINEAREISGLFYIEILAKPKSSLAKIKEIVEQEITALAEKGPTEEELLRRKAGHEYRFISGMERIGGFGGKADRLNRYYTFLGEANAFRKDFERYQKVTLEQVKDSFGRWIAGKPHLDLRFTPSPVGRPDVAEFDRTKPPSMAGKIPFTTPDIAKKTLPNGLDVYVHSRPGLPKVEVALIIERGDLGETAENAGLTYMTTACVDEGTKSRSALEIEGALDELGSHLTTEGDKFGGALGLSSLKRNLGASMEILADVALNPTFPEKEVEIVRKLRLEQILSVKNNPAALASDLFPRILFAGTHAAGIPPDGTEQSITALKREDMVKNHSTYWRPGNAALLFVGDVTVEEAEALAKEHFGSWQKGEVAPVEAKTPPSPSRPYIFLVDRQGVPQSQIRIGSVAPMRSDADYLPIEVMNGILGGTFSSRLNLNLREDKGYAYGAFSNFRMRKYYGYWMAHAGVQTSATVESLKEFRKEIEGLSGGIPVTADELGGLKKNLSRSYLQNFETLSQVIRQIAPLISGGIPLDFLKSYIPGILTQTPSQIQAAAAKHLRFDNSIILVVGDLKKIEKPIVELGWGEVLVIDDEGKLVRRAGEQVGSQEESEKKPG